MRPAVRPGDGWADISSLGYGCAGEIGRGVVVLPLNVSNMLWF